MLWIKHDGLGGNSHTRRSPFNKAQEYIQLYSNYTLGEEEKGESSHWRVEAIFNCTVNFKHPEFHKASFDSDLGTYLSFGLLNFRQDDTEGFDDFQKLDFDGKNKTTKEELGLGEPFALPG